jgi:hypothetical protein
MCDLRSVLQPDEKLKRMLNFLKIIFFLNIISAFLRLWINPSDMFYDLICALFLFLTYNTVYFIYAAIYIIFSLINAVYLFINCGVVIQMIIQDTLGKYKQNAPLYLGISLYLFIFYIFSIIIAYPAYKEMKAQLMESFSGTVNQRLNPAANRQREPDVERPPQNRTGFVAFGGQGVAVG